MSQPNGRVVRFAEFEANLRAGELLKNGERIKVQDQPFQVLRVLLEEAGQLVTRDQLRNRIWPADTFVDFDNSLNTAINRLREALGDSKDNCRFIETLPRRGYRFIAPVTRVEGETNGPDTSGDTTDAPDGRAGFEVARRAAAPRTVAAVATLALTLTAVLIWLVRDRTSTLPPSAHGGIHSLAVLPLENFSGDPAQDYLSDGMTEALIERLSSIHGLRVISRTSAMQFKATRKSVPTIGKELNVDAVIEGSVLRSGEKIRVSIRLLRVNTEEHIWSDTYDRELRDVLALQNDVAQAIAGQIQVAVEADSAIRINTRPVPPAVYDNYLKGRFESHKNTPAGLDHALRYFQAAIDADAAFAPAYAGLADTQISLRTVLIGQPPVEARLKALVAARKCIELDPGMAEAHVLLGEALRLDWHWAEAEAEYRRALALSPSDADAHSSLGLWLLSQGRTEEALVSARRAQELDPLEYRGEEAGFILFYARRYGEAVGELRNVLAIQPDNPEALWYLGFALNGAEDFREAIQILERAASLSHRSSGVLGLLVRAYARGGRRAEALQVLDELYRRRQTGYVPTAAFVNAYLGIGDTEQAFTWLARAVEEQSDIIQWLKVHPFFDPLRGDPRFREFLRRANFLP
jgi:TolB-like protein/DNA-binding winged helix-turn-helix (wHTH) protein/Tfp pilus assembly protein PilF